MGDKNAPMRILFVCRGNKADTISPIIKAQALSLVREGQEVSIYPVNGKDRRSYIKNILTFRKIVKNSDFDVIHAHFGFTALMCSAAVPERRLIVSLMGSEIYFSKWMRIIFMIFSRFFWAHTIVKTADMSKRLKSKRVSIIPNGVDLDVFFPVDKQTARLKLGLPLNKPVILFPSFPFRKEKNYEFIKRVSEKIDGRVLLNFNFEPPQMINYYYNAADVVAMASTFEGSPNTVKEAMACNRPIVSTNVGDIAWITEGTEGCFLSGLNEPEYLGKLREALDFAFSRGETNGRERIKTAGLDSVTVAGKLITLYKTFAVKRK